MSSWESEEASKLEAQYDLPGENWDQYDEPRSKPPSFWELTIGGFAWCCGMSIVLLIVLWPVVWFADVWPPFTWVAAGLRSVPFLGWGIYHRAIARGRVEAWVAYGFIVFAIALPFLLRPYCPMDSFNLIGY